MPPVPVDAKRQDWPRLVANAINYLLSPRAGSVRYEAGQLQWYDGAQWQSVP